MDKKQAHHYYASTAFDWAVADTRAEAIARVAKSAGSDGIKRQVKANGGLYVWSCRVELPQSATYTITSYAPDRIIVDGKETEDKVPIGDAKSYRIQNTKGHVAVED